MVISPVFFGGLGLAARDLSICQDVFCATAFVHALDPPFRLLCPPVSAEFPSDVLAYWMVFDLIGGSLGMAEAEAWAAQLDSAVCQLLVELARVLVLVLASDKMGKMGEFYLRSTLCRCSLPLCQVLLYHLL